MFCANGLFALPLDVIGRLWSVVMVCTLPLAVISRLCFVVMVCLLFPFDVIGRL